MGEENNQERGDGAAAAQASAALVGGAASRGDDDLMVCRTCGAHCPEGYRFCGACGTPLRGGRGQSSYRDPLLGAVVGERYRVMSRIGAGGMGVVYKVEHVRLGKIAAMKVLHGDLTRDELMIRRFNREARAVSRLTSRNTVSVFDYGRSGGLMYLVMEYLQGKDLGAILRTQGTFSAQRVAWIVQQVAHSLREAHALGIVHRDLKPENLYLSTYDAGGKSEELVKVLDFGLAKLVEGREDSASHTTTGSIVGTPHYMSPEQIDGTSIDHRTDIYGLGAVIFRLLTGEPPYRHATPVGVLNRHLRDPVPRLSSQDGSLAPFDPVIRRAMAKRPVDRYASIDEMAEDVLRAARAVDAGADDVITIVSGVDARPARNVGTREEFEVFERRLRRRRALSGLGVAAAAVLVALTLYWGIVEENFARRRVEREPNDEMSSATRLFPNATIEGTIGFPPSPRRGDRDIYVVRTEATRDVVADISVTEVPGIDLILEIYDSSGRRLLAANGNPVDEGERIPNLKLAHPSFYVAVHEVSVAGVPPAVNLEAPYELRVRLRSPYRNEEREPNGSDLQAERLENGERIGGMIGWAGDEDRYVLPSFDGPRMGYDVSVTGATGVDLILEIRNPLGDLIASSDETGERGGERVQFVTETTRDGSPLFARVRAHPTHDSHLFYFVEARTERPPPEAAEVAPDEESPE